MKKRILSLLLALALVLAMTACGDSLEKKLPGTYNLGGHVLQIYSDGTYTETMHYGTGSWTFLEGNILKLTDFYGQSRTYELEDVTQEGIVLKNGSVFERRE